MRVNEPERSKAPEKKLISKDLFFYLLILKTDSNDRSKS